MVYGGSDAVSVVIRQSLIQLRTPSDMLGRVMAVNAMCTGSSGTLGEFRAGVVAAWLGAVPSALIGGFGTILVVLVWMWAFPQLRRVDKLAPERKIVGSVEQSETGGHANPMFGLARARPNLRRQRQAMADDIGSTDPFYMHKPSLMGAASKHRLRPDAIEGPLRPHEGRVPYRGFRRVRLSFRPVTMQSRRFVTEVWADGAPELTIASTSWRSMIEQATQDDSYGAFVRELHRRIAAAGSETAFDTGSPAFLYGRELPCSWPPAWRWRPLPCTR